MNIGGVTYSIVLMPCLMGWHGSRCIGELQSGDVLAVCACDCHADLGTPIYDALKAAS